MENATCRLQNAPKYINRASKDVALLSTLDLLQDLVVYLKQL